MPSAIPEAIEPARSGATPVTRPSRTALQSVREQLIEGCDRCVVCGLCLPVCPTYRTARHEADSPRGRISLIRALASGQLEDSDSLRHHLGRCLVCRACESACPSAVPYGELIVGGRQLLAARGAQPGWWIERLLANRRLLRPALRIGYWLRKIGVTAIVRRGPLQRLFALKQLERLSRQATPPALLPVRERSNKAKHKVAIMAGCLAEGADQGTLQSLLQLLDRLGVAAALPAGQGCCGALAHHRGEQGLARRRLAGLVSHFRAGERVLTLASGCDLHLGGNSQQTDAEVPIFQSAISYLDQLEWPDIELLPLDRPLLLHLPCSIRQRPAEVAALQRLLARIPAAEPVLIGEDGCCGAGGDRMIVEPELAAAVARPLVERINACCREATRPPLLVSPNRGCLLHLGSQLPEGSGIELLHPLELIVRQVPGGRRVAPTEPKSRLLL